ncbi:TIGR02466 family protein [Rhodopila sp.]|uniref:TIGR02466 family protein n=1 Tax=Rhodopila sp. TaxID=2480087 RepID=UPI002C8EAF71|nr:TIGR02466 family protein [Rhodopila sp.]HVZ09241.1 TIGR02466 family protein [Rhodopila sp.]
MRTLREACFGQLFASPVLEHVWADAAALNVALRERILAHARHDPGTQQTNIGGWHSAVGRLDFCGEAGMRLIEHMGAMTEEATRRLYAVHGGGRGSVSWALSAWANVSWKGHSNGVHTHPGATWSGVYYVDDGDCAPGADDTAIHLLDPNAARSNVFFPELSCQPVRFRPQPGLMILFPSYVPHHVPPHTGDRPRISIAFNVRKEPFP